MRLFKYFILASAIIAYAPNTAFGQNQATPAAAQQPVTAAATTETKWAVVCPKDKNGKQLPCQMTKQISLTKTKKQVIAASITRRGEKSTPYLQLAVPLGLFLPAGLTMAVDDAAAQRIAFQTCTQRGCFVALPLSNEQVDSLRRGNQMRVAFQNVNRQTFNVGVSLAGFTASYRKLR